MNRDNFIGLRVNDDEASAIEEASKEMFGEVNKSLFVRCAALKLAKELTQQETKPESVSLGFSSL